MLTTVSVLGKRKASAAANYVLHLNSSPEPPTEPELEPKRKEKCYKCTVVGCGKVYTKPSRLAEHTRSHTGERPFVCKTCQKSYLRESHLQAHARSHLPASDRPFLCSLPNCEKRFWTQQHLRAHVDWHNGIKPFPCTELNCDETFTKHHQLRTHLCTAHAPPGTKPYGCTHKGCTKSFDTKQHLHTHSRVHNEKRYTCSHPSCLSEITFYTTWKSLQNHSRTAHPPTCPYPSCNGRVFSSQKGLRAHEKIHAQREEEEQLNAVLAQENETGDEPPKKRRRGGEFGRDWKCEAEGCGKDFKSNKALTVHHKVTHLGRRDFVCVHKDCEATFGYKHLLQRHVARAHTKHPEKEKDGEGKGKTMDEDGDADFSDSSGLDSDSFDASDDSECESESPASKIPTILSIASITGVAYAARAKELLGQSSTDAKGSEADASTQLQIKAVQCPYPYLQGAGIRVGAIHTSDADPTGEANNASPSRATDSHLSGPPCSYIFRRGYDLHRHLRAVHKLEVERKEVDLWVGQMRAKEGERKPKKRLV